MTYLSASDPQAAKAIPLVPILEKNFASWCESAKPQQRDWAKSCGFRACPGQVCIMPGPGSIEACLIGAQREGSLGQLSPVVSKLPAGDYAIQSDWNDRERSQAALGWGLAHYRFDRYKKYPASDRRLVLDEDIETDVRALLDAQCLVRDLVNTPTEDLGPRQLADAVARQADEFDAECRTIVGKNLLSRNFPAIHVVGRASDRKPRLVHLKWGDKDAPRLTLVGKGVCFDSGGLDIKPAAGMLTMKKDMGGAAHALALARLVMQYRLPVRLELLIAAVENSISGNAYRPGDVISTRKGLSVEIGNTDAEGRVILSDALTYACEREPDLLVDFATLTGAARIAMGADVVPLFSNQLEVARGIESAGEAAEDPMWTLPLYQPYRKLIESPIADINNSGKTSYGGCITAALFLESFVTPETPWVHIDTFAWNQENRPGRPQGGEALGLRAVFGYLKSRYS